MLALLTDIKHTVLRIARWYTHGKKKKAQWLNVHGKLTVNI